MRILRVARAFILVAFGHGGRCVVGCTTPALIGLGSHGEDQCSTVGDVGVAEPGLVPGLAIERGGLNVFVLRGVIAGDDVEIVAIAHVHGDLVEDGAADDVVGARGVDGIEAHRAHDAPGGR